MTVARRLHRLYEIPVRQRRHWTSWYVATGAAPRLFQTLISVAAEADRGLVDQLRRLFVEAWADDARSQFWTHATRVAVLDALAEAGVDRRVVVTDLMEVGRALTADSLDPHSRVESLLQLSRSLDRWGATSDSREAIREAVSASLVPEAHDEDDQLTEWVKRFGDVVRHRQSEFDLNRTGCITMAERLSQALKAGARTAEPATDLVELTFSVDAGLAVELATWFTERGVLAGPEGLAGVLAGAANNPNVPAWLTADAIRSLFMPVAVRALPATAAKLVDRGGEHIRTIIADGVQRWILPSLRNAWGSSIAHDAAASPAPYIGTPPSPSKETDSDIEARSITLADNSELSPEQARQSVSSPADLMELLKRTITSADSWRATPVGSIVRTVAKDVRSRDVPALLAELERVKADADAYAALASALVARGDPISAQPAVDAALRAITMRGWSAYWDGGTRRKFWGELVEIDEARFRDLAIEDLATALRVGAVQLSGLVRDLPAVLPLIGLDSDRAWQAIDRFLEVLCRPMGDTIVWEPQVRSENGTRALLRFVTGFAGHPVRILEWGARNVLRRALLDGDEEVAQYAALAIHDACRVSESSAEAMLGSAASAAPLPSAVKDVLADAIKSAERVHDQIVRDVGRYAAVRLGISHEPATRRPLPLTYSLSVPPVPPRADPIIDDEGIAVLDPTNPRALLGTYDMLLDREVSRLSELDDDLLIRQASRLALEKAEQDSWTRGGVRVHADRLKQSGWIHGFRPWALMVGRRGAAAVLADLVDAGVLPNPAPTTVSIRLGLLDPVLDLVEPEPKPPSLSRPARRDRWGASGSWTADTLDAARIYAAAPSTDSVIGEWANWTELSWERGSERRISVVTQTEAALLSVTEPVGLHDSGGAIRRLERLMHLGKFESAAQYHALFAREAGRALDPADFDIVVGGREWWAEARTGEWLALNPMLGLALDWRLQANGLFVWTDDSGERMAWSRWWIQCLDTHQPPHFDDDAGEGWQVIVSSAGWRRLLETLAPLERRSAVARSGKRKNDAWDAEVMSVEAVQIPRGNRR